MGALDTTNYYEFEKRISGIIEEVKPTLVLNCAGLDYISSSGITGISGCPEKN